MSTINNRTKTISNPEVVITYDSNFKEVITEIIIYPKVKEDNTNAQ